MEFLASLSGPFDEHKPSLFELLSEQQLNSLLPPTLRYLLTIATHRYPRRLLPLLNSFDELYALAALLVERHYLRTRGASFTEHFYGLVRQRALASSAEIPRASSAAPGPARELLTLRRNGGELWKNLAVLVAVPYLKRRLDEAYEVDAPRALLGAAYNQLPPNPTWKDRIKAYARWFLRNIYPSVNAAYYFAILAFNLAYLFDGSRYHNPFLWLIGTRIRRMSSADHAAIEALGKSVGGTGGRPGPRSIFHPAELGSRTLSGLSILLPTSIFALKFLEWWYASDFAKQLSRKAAEGLDLPPPTVAGLPEKGLKGILKGRSGSGTVDSKMYSGSGSPKGKGKITENDEQAESRSRAVSDAGNAPIATPSLLPILTVSPPADSALCPICEEEIATATACQTGIVYCYACIHRWVAGEHPRQEEFMVDKTGRWESGAGRCAVTGRRVLGGTEGLRRIMV